MTDYARRERQPAIGLRDRKRMAGGIELANAARKEGVKPIIGCDFETENGWITLIAETASGWKNLLRLARKQADNPELQIDDAAVFENSAGLILLAGAPGSALKIGRANV